MESLSCQGHVSHPEETATLPGEDRETGRLYPWSSLSLETEALSLQAVVGQLFLRGNNTSDDNSSKHLHNSYYEPGIVLRTACILTLTLLITALEYHHLLSQMGKLRQIQDLNPVS